MIQLIFAATILLSAALDVHRRVHVRQDGIAAAGRVAFGLEHVPGVLPGRLDGGLYLRPPLVEVAWSAAAAVVARRAAVRGLHQLADRRGPGLDAARRGQPGCLALDAADGLLGAALFLHLGQCAAVAGLVLLLRRAGGERPLFPLRGQQSRQPCRIGGLSAGDRAASDARLADAMVGRRLRAADGAVRALCGRGVDRRKATGGGGEQPPSRRRGRGSRHSGEGRFASRRFPCADHAAAAASGGWRWPWCPRRC